MPRINTFATLSSQHSARGRHSEQKRDCRAPGMSQCVDLSDFLDGPTVADLPRVRRADQREAELFAKQGAKGINFDAYDAIDVQVTGPPHLPVVAPLQNFSDLATSLPPFLVRNLQLMHYERPTPIQKHAVPLSLAGHDLMCCAQTGSGACLPTACTMPAGWCAPSMPSWLCGRQNGCIPVPCVCGPRAHARSRPLHGGPLGLCGPSVCCDGPHQGACSADRAGGPQVGQPLSPAPSGGVRGG